MMTAVRRRPWEGYAYFRSQTLTGDHTRLRGEDLGQALERTGLPVGQWVGSGAARLGVAGPVAERQLAALFGEGLHPDADRIVAERTAAGDSAAQALRAAKLGPAFGHYTRSATGELLDAAVQSAARTAGRALSAAEEKALREREATRLFSEDYRRLPEDGAELRRYLAKKLRPDRQPVAAFDYVFTAPKTVSVLWALGDEATSSAVEQAHEQAVLATVAWLEGNALSVRSGAAHLDVTGGLVGARFRHFDSRLGDPLLHDHVLIANVGQVVDEQGRARWRRLDGTLLYGQMVAASEFYNQKVMENVCAALDLRATARQVTPGRRPTIEIEGVDTALVHLHSQRRAQIAPVLERLLDQYRQRHGREPDPAARHTLMRQATLETRPGKKQPRTLAEQRTLWRARSAAGIGTQRAATVYERAHALAQASGPPVHVDVAAAAAAVVREVSERRSVFSRRHLEAQARREIQLLTRGRPATAGIAEQVVAHALGLCVDLPAPAVHRPFAPLTRPDGTSVYRRRGHELYTTEQNLAIEQSLIAAHRTPAIPAASLQLFEQHAADPRHRRLNAGQIALARSFAAGERALRVAVGPAGSGKTSALRLVADTVRAAGGQLIALAPSSRAAQVLAGDLGQSATTVHRWLRAQQRAATGKRIPADLRLRAGDIVVVDEAAMAGNASLAAVARYALDAGAHVRFLGDPSQLGAVEAGGILRWLAQEPDAVHLSELHRFTVTGEGDASLRLREGDTDAITWYHGQGRLHGGSEDHMADAVFTAWSADRTAGHTSVMLAPDSATVDALNRRAQAWQAATGALGAAAGALRDGNTARLGDTLVTRSNQRTWLTLGGRDFVKNGDTWTVEQVLADGAVLVRHTVHRGRAQLPADYLAQYTELGYASTVHRAQGITVDTAHALLTEGTGRENAYVAATRGRSANHLYLPSAEHTPAAALARILATSKAPISAHETWLRAADDAVSIAVLAAQYTDATVRADHLRLAASARTHLGAHAETLLAADAWPTLQRTLLRAEQAGWSAGRILARTARYNKTTATFGPGGHGFDTAWEPAALMSWRVDQYLREATGRTQRTGDPALAALGDDQLTALAATAQRAADRALSASVTTSLGRPLGALTAERTAALARTRALVEAAALVRDRIAAEQRLRPRLPDLEQTAPDHTGPLPDWLADPAAWRDPATPQDWRTHLTERRIVLIEQLRASGRKLAAAPPTWLSPLGDPPPPAAGALRTGWEHAASLAAAWRVLHRTPATAAGLGPRPADPTQHAAYDALAAHLAQIAQHTRAHHRQLARAADAVLLREDAAAHLAAIGRPRPRPLALPEPGPGLARPVTPEPLHPGPAARPPKVTWETLHSEDLARDVLQRITEGRDLTEAWMAYVPAPDPDDADQQQLFLDLVAAIAEWRATRHLEGDEPLGDQPPGGTDAAERWQHLTQALELYQASRVRDRLAQLRARRTEDRERLAAVARQEGERTGRPSRPGPARKNPRRRGRGGGAPDRRGR